MGKCQFFKQLSVGDLYYGTTMPDFGLVIELAFSKKMCIMFAIAILGMVVFAAIDMLSMKLKASGMRLKKTLRRLK